MQSVAFPFAMLVIAFGAVMFGCFDAFVLKVLKRKILHGLGAGARAFFILWVGFHLTEATGAWDRIAAVLTCWGICGLVFRLSLNFFNMWSPDYIGRTAQYDRLLHGIADSTQIFSAADIATAIEFLAAFAGLVIKLFTL